MQAPPPPHPHASPLSTRTTCTRRWVKPLQHFDNILIASWALFCIATSGWLDLAHSAMDAVDVGRQPLRNHQPAMALFFVAFLVVGAFVIL